MGCYNGYVSLDPNSNVVVGALVGGPDFKDNFDDDRRNYMQTEACTYNTSPLVGVFAKLNQLEGLLESSLQESSSFASFK